MKQVANTGILRHLRAFSGFEFFLHLKHFPRPPKIRLRKPFGGCLAHKITFNTQAIGLGIESIHGKRLQFLCEMKLINYCESEIVRKL
jgi:hypothetical protein